ncbi:MAG TPA: hypothetical protein VFQ86_06700, partial [Arachidicoccus soli]|nr:hypothetical protein [Arachidicoccus soli]
MNRKTKICCSKRLSISVLLIGYIAILFTHSFLILASPNSSQDKLYQSSLFSQFDNSVQFSLNGAKTIIKTKKGDHINLKINKHFETETSFLILPSECNLVKWAIVIAIHPVLYHNIYFGSNFFSIIEGRGPPSCFA